MSSLGSGSSSGVSRTENRQLGLSQDSGITTNGSGEQLIYYFMSYYIIFNGFERFECLDKDDVNITKYIALLV